MGLAGACFLLLLLLSLLKLLVLPKTTCLVVLLLDYYPWCECLSGIVPEFTSSTVFDIHSWSAFASANERRKIVKMAMYLFPITLRAYN